MYKILSPHYSVYAIRNNNILLSELSEIYFLSTQHYIFGRVAKTSINSNTSKKNRKSAFLELNHSLNLTHKHKLSLYVSWPKIRIRT